MATYLEDSIPALRILIADLDDEPMYSDARLSQIFFVAARYVAMELRFDLTYTVGVASISPDPSSDIDFLNFVILKAACLTDHGTYRAKALLEGIRVSCGPAAMSLGGHLSGFETLLENGPCAMYEQLKTQYKFGKGLSSRAIISVFTGNQFDARNLYRNIYSNRSGYTNYI